MAFISAGLCCGSCCGARPTSPQQHMDPEPQHFSSMPQSSREGTVLERTNQRTTLCCSVSNPQRCSSILESSRTTRIPERQACSPPVRQEVVSVLPQMPLVRWYMALTLVSCSVSQLRLQPGHVGTDTPPQGAWRDSASSRRHREITHHR